MTTFERRLQRLEAQYPAPEAAQSAIARAIQDAWLETVPDDDLDVVCRVLEIAEQGGDVDAELSVDDKLAMARLMAAYEVFAAGFEAVST